MRSRAHVLLTGCGWGSLIGEGAEFLESLRSCSRPRSQCRAGVASLPRAHGVVVLAAGISQEPLSDVLGARPLHAAPCEKVKLEKHKEKKETG